MKVFKVLRNPRVITAIVSAIGAIVSAVCAGCKLTCGEMSIRDFNAEIYSSFNINTNEVNNNVYN